MSAFFIVPARTKKSMMNLFADHPPLEKRLEALSKLESQLQGTAPSSWDCATSSPAATRSRAQRPTSCSRSLPPTSRSRPSTGSIHQAWRRSSSNRSPTANSRPRSSKWKKSSGRPAAMRARPSPRRTTASATAGWSCATRPASPASKTWRSASMPFRPRSRQPATVSACCVLSSAFWKGEPPPGAPPSKPVYFIYNYKRGHWYPFVPTPGTAGGDGTKPGERSTERELATQGPDGL